MSHYQVGRLGWRKSLGIVQTVYCSPRYVVYLLKDIRLRLYRDEDYLHNLSSCSFTVLPTRSDATIDSRKVPFFDSQYNYRLATMWIRPLIVTSFVFLVTSEVLDLGSLDQYNAQLVGPIRLIECNGLSLTNWQTSPPQDIQGDGIWIGQGNGGFNVALGQDVTSKIHGVLEGCGDIDDQCYQDVNKIFDTATIQIDKESDRRGLAQHLSNTLKKWTGSFMIFTSILLSEWNLKSTEIPNTGMWLADSQAQNAAAVVAATGVTISAEGKAIATITQVLVTKSLQG
jgi:hypothetical protein